MLGGSISRYHTPHLVSVQTGSGIAEDLIKIAGPTVVGALERGVTDVQQGKRAQDVAGREAKRVLKELKRKAPAVLASLMGHKRSRDATIFD